MSNSKEHWIKNPWIVTPVFILFTPPITAVWDLIKGFPFLTTFKTTWNLFVNFELKLWWIIIYILLTSMISTIRLHYINKKKVYVSLHRTYLRFTAVKFGKYKWKWSWVQDTLTKDIEIENLMPVCPINICENNGLEFSRDEVRKEGSVTYTTPFHKCHICGNEYVVDKSEREIRYYIEQRINEDSFVETTGELPEFAQ